MDKKPFLGKKILVPGKDFQVKTPGVDFPIPDLTPRPVALRVAPKPKRILIGMPFGRPMDLIPIRAWVQLIIETVRNPRYLLLIRYTRTAYLDLNRDSIAQHGLDEGCDFILMIDTDMSYPSNLLDVLISRDKDVIGVPYYSPRWNPKKKKADTIQPLIFDYHRKKHSWYQWPMVKQTEPFRADAVGTGIMLFKLEVFKKLEKPWFPFFYHPKRIDTRIMGEDLGFCLKCMGKDIEVWVDPTFGDEIKHWKSYGYSKKDCTEK